MTAETRACRSCTKEFQIDSEDFNFYEKIAVPPPTWCPTCRAIRRMLFLNESQLFRRTDSQTGKEIFSSFSPHAPFTVWDRVRWWSDAWDPLEYAKEIDWTRPFLAQVKELMLAIPWPSQSVHSMVDSEYCNNASSLKNCYLCFNGAGSENSMYCIGFQALKETLDSYNLLETEQSYEVFQGDRQFQCCFSSDSSNCRNVWFSRDCVDCSDCFGCVNLRHKKYCMWNVQYTKEEYEKKRAEIDTGSHRAIQNMKAKLRELYLQLPHKYMHGLRNVNVVGDYVDYVKNGRNIYDVFSSENIRYSENIAAKVRDSYDFTSWGQNAELIYEAVSCGDQIHNLRFCYTCWGSMRDSEYCMSCHSSVDLFGCIGLRNKQYCILNKQYTKEEYEQLVPRIREHMKKMPYRDTAGREYSYGEFFPSEFSPHAYNETIAFDYYPKNQEEAKQAGYLWREPEAREFETTMQATDLPDHIQDVQDDITKQVIQCGACKRAYRILEAELAFYRRFSLPVPQLCHRCRQRERQAARNPRAFYSRQCMCDYEIYTNTAPHQHHLAARCPNEFETTFAPGRKEIVYCEPCYQAEVI